MTRTMSAGTAGRLAAATILALGIGMASAAEPADTAVTRLSTKGSVSIDEYWGKTLHVTLTTMAGLKEYQVRIDDGPWQQSKDIFVWTLHPGMNRLEAKSISWSGVEGPVSTIELPGNEN